MPTATSSRATKAAVGAAALLVTGLALTGCGGSGSSGKTSSDSTVTPSASSSDIPSSSAPTASTGSLPPSAAAKPETCGKVQVKGNEESVVRIKGTAACPSLMTIITDYFKAPKSSGGVATVKGWKCRTASPAENRKYGYITLCVKGPDEFATKLHH